MKTLNKNEGKTKISTIALVLVLTIAATIVALPTVNAEVETITSYMYLTVSPNPVGVGQEVLVIYWTAAMPWPETEEEIAAGLRGAWYGVSITVTKPDNETETIEMPRSDPVGGGYTAYTPDQIGTYYFQAHLPAQWRNTTGPPDPFVTYGDRYYTADDSNIMELTVQQEEIEPWPETPLPTEFWTRPINAMNREWWQLTGSMLGGTWMGVFGGVWPPGADGGTTDRYNYGSGPESAHIMWTKPYWAGGIMDYQHGSTGFQTHHYQGLEISPIILYGKIYYAYRATAHASQGYVCVDLYTGETIYYKNETMPSYATIYDYESPNQHGGFPYLWRTSGVTLPEGYTSQPGTQTWQMLDGYTGNTVCYIANVSFTPTIFFAPGATITYGLDGSILAYDVVGTPNPMGPFFPDVPPYYLAVWNSSAIPSMLAATTGTGAWQWRPMGGGFPGPAFSWTWVHDGNQGFSVNASIPNLQGPRNPRSNQTASIRAIREGEYVIFGTPGLNDPDGIAPCWLMAVSLERGREGEKLWETSFTPPFAEEWRVSFLEGGMGFTGVYPEYEVVLFNDQKQLKYYAYDMKTGQKLWESEPENPLNYYSMINNVYEGKLLTCGYGGELIAYNITTGEIVWKYIAKSVGFESPYGGNYPINIYAIADGKIYTTTGEHSITQPIWRGQNLRCIDAETGEEIWKISFFSANGGAHLTGIVVFMGERHIVGLNYYDNQIYCYGKGPSATTVTASPSIIAKGDSVLIKGTVIDTAAGTKQLEQAARFPNGVPAISDADMSAWMEYVYMQQPIPADATGVEVSLDAVDPNGNFIHIGETTSDMSGTFSYIWTPEIEGKYSVMATFVGSKSYYASFAETAIGVGPAPEEPVTPATPEGVQEDIDRSINSLTPMFLGIIVAVVVAIVLVVYDIISVRKLRK